MREADGLACGGADPEWRRTASIGDDWRREEASKGDDWRRSKASKGDDWRGMPASRGDDWRRTKAALGDLWRRTKASSGVDWRGKAGSEGRPRDAVAPLGTLVGSDAGRREAANASSVMPAAGSATTARGASRLGAGSGARPSGRSLDLVNSSRVHPALLSSARKDGGRAKPRPRSASGRHGSMMRESEGVRPSRVTRPLGRCSQGEEHPTSRNRFVTSYSDMR